MKRLHLMFILLLLFANYALVQAQFQHFYGDLSTDEVFVSAAATTNNNYIMWGYTHSNASHGSDFYLVKTNAQGQQLWKKEWAFFKYDYGCKVLAMPNGQILVVGSSFDWMTDTYEGYYAMLDASGQILWQNSNSLPLPNVELYDAIHTSDGNVLIMGGYKNPGGVMTTKLVKIDATGTVIFNQNYPTLIAKPYYKYSLVEKNNSDILLSGYINSQNEIVSFQSNGTYITETPLNMPIYNIAIDANAIYIFGSNKLYKYDTNFNLIWQTPIFFLYPSAMLVLNNGNILIGTSYKLNVFDKNTGALLLTNASLGNASKYNSFYFAIEKSPTELVLGGFSTEVTERQALFERVDATNLAEISHTIYGQVGVERDEYARAMTPTNDGGFLMVGYNFENHTNNIKTIKVNNQGIEEWKIDLGLPNESQFPVGVCNAHNNGYIVGGYKLDTINDAFNLFTTKLDLQGVPQWTKSYSTGGVAHYTGNIKPYPTGGYIMIGSGFQNSSWNNTLLRLDNNGDTIWVKRFDVGSNSFQVNDLCVTQDGGIVLSGKLDNTLNSYFCKTDSNGNLLWTKNYFFPNYPYWNVMLSAVEDSISGNLYTCGYYDHPTTGIRYPYILKTNAIGDSLGSYIYLDTLNVYKGVRKLCLTPNHTLMAFGFRGVANQSYLTISEFDLNLNLLWEKEYINWIGQAYIDGAVLDNGNIVAFVDAINTKYYNNYDYYLQMTNAIGTFVGVDNNVLDFEVNVYPNPSKGGKLFIEINSPNTQTLTEEVYDMSGKLCHKASISLNKSELDLSHLASGTYFLRMMNQDNKIAIKKVIKI